MSHKTNNPFICGLASGIGQPQRVAGILAVILLCPALLGQSLPLMEKVARQPLTEQAVRVVDTMSYLGSPLAPADEALVKRSARESDSRRAVTEIQKVLDKYVLLEVRIDPEERVSVKQGPAKPELIAKGWRSFLVKIDNEAGITAELQVKSPNSAPVYVVSNGSTNPKRTVMPADIADRWLSHSLYTKAPLQSRLSGLRLEYAILSLYSRDEGMREAQFSFDVGQGTQDIGFRSNIHVLFKCHPSVRVRLRILDENGRPATASFIFRDQQGRVYPSQAKRLAPDFFFQPQIYRSDGETIDLPPGHFTVECKRGPEYLVERRAIEIAAGRSQTLTFHLKRWINPAQFGWYSGDDHIHPAGCAHYQDPSEGVYPKDMMRQILGEALNVGSVLDWGPCWYFQRQFVTGKISPLSRPDHIMRYDVEVSGFPSSFCGHLVLLGLKSADYPGTTRIEQWPTWDLPILRWAHSQGAVVGFAHSGWGLELRGEELPNYEIPPFDGIGANEYIVDVTYPNVVDFISAGDTPAPWELNIWYHTLNCGFRTRISGETDFPCIFDERVGIGRVYVKVDGQLNFRSWLEGLRAGRSYVSDGRSHLMDFTANGLMVGTRESEVRLAKAGTVHISAQVAALLSEQPNGAIRNLPYDQKPYWDLERSRIRSTRQVPVEVILNGYPVAHKNIIADGKLNTVAFDIPISQSSWVALRIPRSSHTNPIFILVGGKPIRASRRSAEWCLHAVDQCWSQKESGISESQQPAAREAYDHARNIYQRILAQCPAN